MAGADSSATSPRHLEVGYEYLTGSMDRHPTHDGAASGLLAIQLMVRGILQLVQEDTSPTEDELQAVICRLQSMMELVELLGQQAQQERQELLARAREEREAHPGEDHRRAVDLAEDLGRRVPRAWRVRVRKAERDIERGRYLDALALLGGVDDGALDEEVQGDLQGLKAALGRIASPPQSTRRRRSA